jgi:hypothetical protein
MSREFQIRLGVFGTPAAVGVALTILPVFWNGLATLLLVALGLFLIFKPSSFRSS